MYYSEPTGHQTVLETKEGLTQFVCNGERRLQAVVLDDEAASLGITHGAHVRHAHRLTAVVSTDVLRHKQEYQKQKTGQAPCLSGEKGWRETEWAAKKHLLPA